MLTGFFDDTAEKPWGEWKKGILDLLVAVAVSATYIYYNGCGITFFGMNFTLHPAIFMICAIILVWVSINVTNCADGVDGLSVRLAYPEAALKELGEYLSPPVGKSGVNHRLRKLSELAEKLRS